MTALHWAVKSNSADCVERLLQELNISVNSQDIVSWTPLHYAVYLKEGAIVELLLKHKHINIEVKNNQGKKPQDLVMTKEIGSLFKIKMKTAQKPAPDRKTFKDVLMSAIEDQVIMN